MELRTGPRLRSVIGGRSDAVLRQEAGGMLSNVANFALVTLEDSQGNRGHVASEIDHKRVFWAGRNWG